MTKTVQHKADIERKRPPRKNGFVAPAMIFPGCCSPYPDVNYNQRTGHDHTPTLYMHHVGSGCAGHLEPADFDKWYYGPRRVR